MSFLSRLNPFLHRVRNPEHLLRVEPTPEQKEQMTEAIRTQRFYGDLPGRREYQDH